MITGFAETLEKTGELTSLAPNKRQGWSPRNQLRGEPIFQVATTREGSGVHLVKEADLLDNNENGPQLPTTAAAHDTAVPWLLWRHGRVSLSEMRSRDGRVSSPESPKDVDSIWSPDYTSLWRCGIR